MKRAFNHVRVLETDNGVKIEYSELDINFSYKFTEGKNINQCKIDIYNLSHSTILKLRKSESVRLTAGYTDFNGVIFNGTIDRVSVTKSNNGDVLITLECTPGTISWNDMFISKSWERYTPYEDIVKDIVDEVGWSIGSIAFSTRSDGTTYKYVNAKFFRRPARECLEQIAKDANMNVSFVDGKVYMYPVNYTLNKTITVSVNDGSLIEIPLEQKTKSENKIYKIKTVLRYDYIAGNIIVVKGSDYIDASDYKIIEGTHVGSDNAMYSELTIERVNKTTTPSSDNTDLYGLTE